MPYKMAKYMKHKFNWKLFKPQKRFLSNKLDAIALSNPAHSSEEDRGENLDDAGSNRMRYNVCRDRTSSCRKFVFEDKNAQNDNLAESHQEQLDHASAQQEEDFGNSNNTGGGTSLNGYRAFAASTTYKNVTLPLKSAKLANPFPEPVKVMPSHTVSDQEKAEQMQAECRIPRSITKSKRMN